MNGDDTHSHERQGLQTRLLDAVKQCQVRFGGRTELATETDARVSCLCSAWESVLQHGLKGETRAIAALKQVTEITGLNKVAGMFTEKPAEKEMAFWSYIKEVLTKHEADRFTMLKNINTESGRGRSWLRASLNEHSLERYMHMLIESTSLLTHYYESWAFLFDQEKSSMLPMMARGLDSILFAITVDNGELNAVLRSIGGTSVVAGSLPYMADKSQDELRPVIAGESPPDKEVPKKKEKKKKKKVAHIVSFDEDESGLGKFSRVNNSPLSKSGSFSHDYMSEVSNNTPSKLPNSTDSSSSYVGQTVSSDSTIGAIKRDSLGFKSIDQSGTVLQRQADESVRPKRSVNSEHSDNVMSSQPIATSNSAIKHLSRDPSIASAMSDTRSRGSISSTDFDLSMEMNGMTPLTPGGEPALDDDSVGFSRSCDSGSLSAFNGEDIQSATFALQQAQISFNESHRTQGDGGNMNDDIHSDTMSTDELKKAVVSMMLRKDEVEEQYKSLKQVLEQEMDTSSVLRAEIEDLKHQSNVKQEKELNKLQALQKENELLKHQLRKYVNAVQMLRTEGASVDVSLGIHVDEPQPTIPPEKPVVDYSQEAEEYEKKLIQVAEMHGELMEFNEMLHRQLNLRENMLKRLQNELVDLRGPLPHDINFTDDLLALGAESLAIQQTRLINVWIPSAFLRGKASDSHHVYQVYVRIRDEEWNVYKRYKQFNELHASMKKKYPLTAKFEFPPKKSFGKKDNKVVESRRHLLQTYLRCLINLILEKDAGLSGNACKHTLIEALPFFSDKLSEKDKKKQRKKSGGQISPLSSSPRQGPSMPEYGGL